MVVAVAGLASRVAHAEPQLLAFGERGISSGEVTIFDAPVEGAAYKKQRTRKVRALPRSAAPAAHTTSLSPRWLDDCPPPPTCTACTDEEAEQQPRCADLDGTTTTLGATGLEQVVIFDVEFTAEQCALRDPATGRFASPAGESWTEVSTTGSCDGAPPSEPSYLLAGAVCRPEATGVACVVPADGSAFAWVDPV